MYQSRWGFSDELGTVMYGDNNQDEVFLGYSIGRQQTVSEATAQKIDAEVRRLRFRARKTSISHMNVRGFSRARWQ